MHGPAPSATIFREVGESHYALEITTGGIALSVDRLRRDRDGLIGELSVRCALNGAQTIDGYISIADFNLSSAQARTTRAKMLLERSGAELPWALWIEELCQRVIRAERQGSPHISLRDVERPSADRMAEFDGVRLPMHHPAVLFGDGGSAKSYLALWWAGRMVQAGRTVLLADWEFAPQEHRERLELLFGPNYPEVLYLRCYRSLHDERERLAKAIGVSGAEYLICDSVGLACGGDPCSSEACTNYFQDIRRLGDIGSLHIAHVTKGSFGKPDDQKPFGSAFWHNMARVTYNIKGEQSSADRLAVGLYPRKRNLRGHWAEAAFEIEFGDCATRITPSRIRDHVDLTEGLPLGERIAAAVEDRSKTRRELAEELNVPYAILQSTIYRELKRKRLVEVESTKKGQSRIGLAPKFNEVEF